MLLHAKVSRLALIFLALVFATSTVAGAQLVAESLPFEGGSWTWGNAHRHYGGDDLGFNQLKWVWRLDLNTGGLGPWESPFFDTFTTGWWWDSSDPGTPESSWALDIASPYYSVASGNLAGGPDWFSYKLHFEGSWAPFSEAGFNFGAYRDGVWVGGYTRHFGYEGPEGITWFSNLDYLTEAQFDSYPPVPEPAWLSIIGLGFFGGYVMYRRRKSA